MRRPRTYVLNPGVRVDFNTEEKKLYDAVRRVYPHEDASGRILEIDEGQCFFDFFETSNQAVYTIFNIEYGRLREILPALEGDFDIRRAGTNEFLMARQGKYLFLVE